MKISTKGRYALRVMLDLALHDNGDPVPLKDVAKRQEITVKYLEQVITPLARSGYVLSVRGASGGYRLAKSAGSMTCGEILRTMEGPLEPVACLIGDAYLSCPRSESCETLDFWKGLSKVINEYVDSISLQDLIDRQPAGQDDYVI